MLKTEGGKEGRREKVGREMEPHAEGGSGATRLISPPCDAQAIDKTRRQRPSIAEKERNKSHQIDDSIASCIHLGKLVW